MFDKIINIFCIPSSHIKNLQAFAFIKFQPKPFSKSLLMRLLERSPNWSRYTLILSFSLHYVSQTDPWHLYLPTIFNKHLYTRHVMQPTYIVWYYRLCSNQLATLQRERSFQRVLPLIQQAPTYIITHDRSITTVGSCTDCFVFPTLGFLAGFSPGCRSEAPEITGLQKCLNLATRAA